MWLRKFGTTLVFNPKAKTMVKMVEIFSLCFSILAVFQRAGRQCFVYSLEYTSPTKLKIAENLDHEICDHLVIQLTSKKSHIQGGKFQQYPVGYKLDNRGSFVLEVTLEFHNSRFRSPKNFEIFLGHGLSNCAQLLQSRLSLIKTL